MKLRFIILVLALLFAAWLFISKKSEKNKEIPAQTKKSEPAKKESLEYLEKYDRAILRTNYGNIKIKFYNADAPMTVNNFLKLSSAGFYNGVKFHRVIRQFMIQSGDPKSKDNNWDDDGIGGPGYAFKDEINSHKLARGSLAMANSGPNTNGSQFFIVTAGTAPWLDGKHTNFGEVIEGMDVVDKIENVKTGVNDHPVEDVVINGVELVERQK